LKTLGITHGFQNAFLAAVEEQLMNPIAVITEPCVGVCDTACVDACPVDCIHGPLPVSEIRTIGSVERETSLHGVQMFVNPKECIGCWACIPVCPVSAIYEDTDVPEEWRQYIEANARFFEA
jgi:NAD-dependent dihydropyrimidine dehydrogenase PreA subunit